MISRRYFLGTVVGGAAGLGLQFKGWCGRTTDASLPPGVSVTEIRPGEDSFAYIRRVNA